MSYWGGKKVLITGGAGFLGSHLARALMSQGASVTLVSHMESRPPLLAEGAGDYAFQVADIADFEAVAEVLDKQRPETVFHTAARSIVGEANLNPRPAFETNIKGAWNVLEACRQSPFVQKLVVSSSDKAYGETDRLPYLETTPLCGSHPYDVSKSCADLLAQTYFNTYGLPVCITRCGNYFGPGDPHLGRIFPGAIRSVLAGEAPVIRSDGQSVRDYLYIKDGAAAHLLLAEKMDDPAIHGQAFNFSNGRPMSVLEVIKSILKEMNREDLSPIVLGQAANEIKAQYLSSEKAAAILGWGPKYSFAQALRETVAWYSGKN